MLGIRNVVLNFSAIILLLFSMGYASSQSPEPLTKMYISPENLFIQDGRLLVLEGQEILQIKTLHQDSEGVYYYAISIYGRCPNGHSYNLDGGCTGAGCLYN